MIILNRFYIKDPELEDLRYDDRMDVCWKLLCNGKLADSGFGMAFCSFVSPCLFFQSFAWGNKTLGVQPTASCTMLTSNWRPLRWDPARCDGFTPHDGFASSHQCCFLVAKRVLQKASSSPPSLCASSATIVAKSCKIKSNLFKRHVKQVVVWISSNIARQLGNLFLIFGHPGSRGLSGHHGISHGAHTGEPGWGNVQWW